MHVYELHEVNCGWQHYEILCKNRLKHTLLNNRYINRRVFFYLDILYVATLSQVPLLKCYLAVYETCVSFWISHVRSYSIGEIEFF